MAAHSLENEPWYHGKIGRGKAESMLAGKSPGHFLVRESSTVQNNYVLSVSENRRVSHYIITRKGGQYNIGNEDFATISDVVEYFKRHFLDTTTLVAPVPVLPAQLPTLHRSRTPSPPPPPLPPRPPISGPPHEGAFRVRGKYDFQSDDPEDLPFQVGDVMTVVREDEDEWWTARHADGRTGLIPVPYITLVDDRQPIVYARVLMDREAPYDPTALSFKKGEIIKVTSQREDGMWKGVIGDRNGWFPFKLVEILQEGDKDLYENAMLKGFVKSGQGLVMLVGVTGSGKSEFKRLVLSQPVPEFSPSTPLAESAVRSMSVCHVAVDGIEWMIVGPQEMLDMVARTIKENCPTLEQAWGQLGASGDVELSVYGVEIKREETKETREIEDIKETKEIKAVKSKAEGVKLCNEYGAAMQRIDVDSMLLEKMTKSFTTDEVKKLMDVDFIYLLDSGGQPPFREMLPHFVQQASAVVLMQKLNERLDFRPTIRYRRKGGKVDKGYVSQLTNEQILHQYIQGVQSHKSKVFVVGTHHDKEGECKGETRKEKNRKLLEAFRPVLSKQMELYKLGSLDELIFPVNSKSRNKEVEEVAKEFRRRVMEKCMAAKEKIPIPWFILEQLLQLLAHEMKVSVLSLDECCEAAKQKLLMPRNVCEAALRFLGRLSIIYYRPTILPGVVFCSAQVVLDKLTELVRCSHALRTEEGDSSAVPSCIKSNDGLQFREYGLLDSEILERAFPSHYREDLFSPPDLLHLLEGLLIAGRLNSGEHFIPSLLPDLPSERLVEFRLQPDHSPHPAPLLIHYPKMWVPVGVTASLVVYLQDECKWEPSETHGAPTCMYHNCFQFKLPGKKPGKLTIIDSTKFLEVHLKCPSTLAKLLCPQIKDSVMQGLRESHKSLHYKPPETEIGFLCTGACGNRDPHLAELDDGHELWICIEDTSIGDELMDTQKMWLLPLQENDEDVVPPTLLPKSQRRILCPDDLHDLRSILQPVTHRWKHVGVALRLDLGQLKKTEQQYRDLDDCLTEMLSLWLNKNYNTEKFGQPSLQLLAGAVGAPAGGNDSALADKIQTIKL